jgi:hypothetical protein
LMAAHFAARIAGHAEPTPAEGQLLLDRMNCIETIRRQGGLIGARDG